MPVGSGPAQFCFSAGTVGDVSTPERWTQLDEHPPLRGLRIAGEITIGYAAIPDGALSMKIKLIGSGLVAGLLLVVGFAAPANAKPQRNYDCSKAGNANKAVCKTAAKPTAAPKAAGATRNYDCSKAGNANKTACKGKVAAAPAARPAAAPATRNYDCTKAGNANKTVCKGKVAAAPAPVVRSASARAPSAATRASGPQGATAKCRDNTYSHSATHSGTCSHHGGVAQRY